MSQYIEKLGIITLSLLEGYILTTLRSFFRSFGGFFLYVRHVAKSFYYDKKRIGLILSQIEFLGNQSVKIILISGVFLGAVFALQIGEVFSTFRAESIMGAATAQTMCRELAPVMVAFLTTGRGGAAMTAELATMKVNEQVDAMEAMAVDPISYLVVPRLIATVFIMPVLTTMFIVVGILGAFLVGIAIFDVDQGVFFDRIVHLVQLSDLRAGIEKSIVFGTVIALICCRYGLSASGGAKGVGRATTNSVVLTLLLVLCCDFVLTYMQVML
jgi:phospholipid/cholesterol/gamma-HCH transport system permease protein